MTAPAKTDKLLGSKFLYADDLLKDGKWVEARLTISRHVPGGTLTGADKSTVDADAIGFDGTDKLLVLNKTNTRLLKIATGSSKPAGWIGKTVALYPVSINAFGQQNLPCIRVRVADGQPTPFGVRKFLGRDLTV